MSAAKLEKQIFVQTNNKVGTFAEIAEAVAGANVNLRGICAWSVKNEAFFALLTDNNAKAIAGLTKKGLKAQEQDAVTVALDDKVGAAAALAKKIKDAAIDLNYIYGTTCGCGSGPALMVLVSKENTKLASVLNR